MRRPSKWGAVFAAALASAWSCVDATDVELLEIAGTGVVLGQAFLDLNGDGNLDAGDSPLSDIAVVLVHSGTQQVAQQVSSDSIGVFVLLDIPVGDYSLLLDSALLGDSLMALGAAPEVSVAVGDTSRFDVGVSYPELTLQEVRAAAPGRRVFTFGVALNPRQSFSDGVVHFKHDSAYLRMTDVAPGALFTGDSLRLLGTTAVDAGQPVLDEVTPLLLRSLVEIPLPSEVTTGAAATAAGGSLDAALVRVRAAEIADTSTAPNGDFHFWADDGTDSVEVVFRWFLGISPAPAVRPDTTVRVLEATGLLSPRDDGAGGVRWQLIVRSPAEIVTEVKQVDVAVTTSFDPTQASTGDTVEISVTVSNAGPQTATGVEVDAPVPVELRFLAATTTVGSYDDASGLWTLADLAPGSADTLRISAEVLAGAGSATSSVQLRSLTREVDTNAVNDSDSADLTIS